MSKTSFYSEIRKNNFKTYLLLLAFFIFILIIGYAFKLVFAFTGFGILFFAGAFAIIFALVGYYSGDKIVLSTSKAKPIQPNKYPKHRFLDNVVEGLAIAAGIPKPKLYVINDPSPNAFATGRDPEHSSIAVTSGLLETLNREELEGVIAHEMSHIRNRDIKVMTIVTVLFGLIAMASDIAIRSMIFGGVRGGDNNKGNVLIMIIAIVLIILSPIVAMMLKMSISRKREYLADASGAKLTRYPQGLANALKKISSVNRPVKFATKGTAHLYISNPLALKGLSKMFATHPPIDERIKRLEAM
jgi:heat shock protein HtpX